MVVIVVKFLFHLFSISHFSDIKRNRHRRSFHTCDISSLDGLQSEFQGIKWHDTSRVLFVEKLGEKERKWFAVVEMAESQIRYEWKVEESVLVWDAATKKKLNELNEINGSGVIWQEKWKNFDVIIIIVIIININNIIKMLLCSIFSFFLPILHSLSLSFSALCYSRISSSSVVVISVIF